MFWPLRYQINYHTNQLSKNVILSYHRFSVACNTDQNQVNEILKMIYSVVYRKIKNACGTKVKSTLIYKISSTDCLG